MPISKTEIIETIKGLPQDEFADIDDLLEELVFIDKIRKGVKAMENGEVRSEEEANNIMKSWG